jgi:formylmethanofuran dehydrogenase subunit E
MWDIPDHPDIRSAGRTGYPVGHKERIVIKTCYECGFDIYADEGYYHRSNGEDICKRCNNDEYVPPEEDE